jgi:hypothetical protein
LKQINVKELAAIAEEIDTVDPIDWGELAISEQEAYKLMASHVLEMFDNDEEDVKIIMMATVTKLLVENFVLNLKMFNIVKNNS